MKKPPRPPRPPRPPLRAVTDAEIDDAISQTVGTADGPILHDLFNQQIRAVLDDAGLSEEEKQSVLVAMSCPCCGGGSTSFTYKLKPKA